MAIVTQLVTTLSIISLHFQQTLAQGSFWNHTLNDTCGRAGYETGVTLSTPVDATGVTEFHVDGPTSWFLSVGLNQSSAQHRGTPYLSIPRIFPPMGSDVCLYQLGGLNVSATGPGMNGCEGVLKQGCIDALQKTLLPQRASDTDSSDRPVSCENRLQMKEIKEACGDVVTALPIVHTQYSTRFSNTSCTVPAAPGISLENREPTGYITVSYAVRSLSDRKRSLEEAWDLHVRQVSPWIVAKAYSDVNSPSSTYVVCTSYNWTREGTRKPEGPWPPAGSPPGPFGAEANSAASTDLRVSMAMVLVLSGFALITSIW